MKRTLIPALGLLLALAVGGSVDRVDSRTKETMKFKLHYAQSVLEGIALEDYPLIAVNAKKLKGLSESAGWRYRQSAEYQRHTGDFARQAEALVKAAERKNLDAATVAYFQLTASCVACHRHLRGSQEAKLDLPSPRL
jgi:hypothetical protein